MRLIEDKLWIMSIKKLLFTQKKVITVLVSVWGDNYKHIVSGCINWFILSGGQLENIY